MPPKKKLGKELPVEGSSQAVGEQVPTTAQTTTHIPQTLHPQPSTNFHAATANLTEQSTAQAEVLVMNTSTPNTAPPPSHQYQTIETKEDMLQASEEEIEAVIEDELVRLHQENECLRLKQEHLARRKVVAKRSQVMPQQIDTRKDNPSRAVGRNRVPSSARARTLNARAPTAAATTSTSSAPVSATTVVETNIGQCR
jgi:ABC-type Fe2+-enterobactin transport system substrate-binding protein